MSRAVLTRGLTLLVNNGVGQGLAFLTSVAVGRLLGVTGFGEYAAVMAVVFVLGTVAEAGLEGSLSREVARDPANSRSLLAASLRAKVAIGGGLALLLAATPVARLLSPTDGAATALRLAGLLVTLNAVNSSFSATFRAWGRMEFVLAINVAGLSVQLLGTVAVLLYAPSVTALVGWLVLVQVGELVGGWGLYVRGEPRAATGNADQTRPMPAHDAGQRRGPWGETGALVRRSLPLALAGVLTAFDLRVDLFLIEGLRGARDVGIYSVAMRLYALLALAPSSFFPALFPAMAAAHGRLGDDGGERLYARSLRGMASAGFIGAAAGIVLASPLVAITFGPAYAAAVPSLRLLAFMLLPALLNSTAAVFLYATGREGLANRMVGLDIVLRAGLGWVLVARWGAPGAALADLLAATTVLTGYWLAGALRFADHGGVRHEA